MRGRIAGGAIALMLAATTTGAATQPVAPFDKATWTSGTTGFNAKLYCLSLLNCFSYTVMMNTVSVRGPENALTSRPKVGERFYIRTELAVLPTPFDPIDTYRTRVLLPEGVTPSVTAPDDVICAITTTSNVTVRIPGPLECQDPVQNGVMWEFPAVSLSEDTMSQVWFPVVATKPIDGSVIQMLGQATLNPATLLPNPVLSEVALYVDPAAGSGGTGSSSPSPSASQGTGSATTPLTGIVTKPTGSGLALSWAPATAPGVTGYRVQARLVRTKKWVNAGTTTTPTFRWRKAKRGKRYQVRVAAIIGGVVGAWSKPVTITAK